jgi:penicillin-binding protein 1B
MPSRRPPSSNKARNKSRDKGRKARPGPRAKARARHGRGAARRWLKPVVALTVLLVLVLGGYAVHLGKTVRVKFDGKRWAEPARIYARPLELYAGTPVSAEQLRAELAFLGYRQVERVAGPAQWSSEGRRFHVHTRDFRFPDGAETGRSVVLTAGRDRIERIVTAGGGREVDLLRLEPALVGSIYPAHSEDRVLVQHGDLPGHLVQALLAVEDRRFFDHPGIDLRGIARALVANLRAGRAVQGGSTLTQQLVKNFILGPERTLWRKFNEALMSLIVESRYAKDEILEAYANEIFLGQDGGRAIHGFGLAAYFYFNRPLTELALHETALLVGMVRGASYYNPRRHPERALERRNLVIDQMAGQGFVDAQQAEAAKQRPLGVTAAGNAPGYRVPAFVELVRRQLRRDYREEDLTSNGLRVFTTLDPWVQRAASRALHERLARIERDRGIASGSLQGAVVVTSVQDGEVLAVVGGRDAAFAGFNRALDAVRPIGSLVKPVVYLSALAIPERYTLTTPVEDAAVDMTLRGGQRWQPKNYDREVHGRVPLHEALARSLNLATVRLGMDVGLGPVIATLRGLGVRREIDPYPSLLLGALSLSPLEVTQVYQGLAAGGFRSPLRAIRAVIDAERQPLSRFPLTVTQAADPAVVYLLTRNLVEVTERGTGASLRRWLPDGVAVAGKTGTTNDLRDSWFAGYGADRVAVVWVGRDDNAPIGLSGATGALPVWGDLVQGMSIKGLRAVPPAGVDYHWVDRNGRLAAADCVDVLALPYIAGSQPRVLSDCVDAPGVESHAVPSRPAGTAPAASRGLEGFLRDLFE